MVRKLMTAALILTLGLRSPACGNETAGTAANRWTGTNAASQEWAIQRQSDARGPLEDRGNGAYHADETAVWTATTLTAPTAPGAAPKRT